MTAAAAMRLAVIAFSVAAVQAASIDRFGGPLRHLDLPLVVAITLVMTRPVDAAVTGFVFGLAVDLFQLRLFGLHSLAYCTLGPVAVHVPLSALRRRGEAIAVLVSAQTVVVSMVVALGAWLVDGRVPGGAPVGGFVWHLCQAAFWSVIVVVPLTSILGGRIGSLVPPMWSDRSDALHPADRR